MSTRVEKLIDYQLEGDSSNSTKVRKPIDHHVNNDLQQLFPQNASPKVILEVSLNH